MIFIKVAILQSFWFLVVLYGHLMNSFLLISLSLFFMILNFILYSPKISFGRYLFLAGVFTIFGFCHDSFLIWAKMIEKNSYHFGFLSLWIIFIAYYDDVFLKMKKFPLPFLSLSGGLGGAVAYWSAYKLGALSLAPATEISYLIATFILWAVFFPLSLWLFNHDHYWDFFLDKLIIFSFDQSGYLRHQKKFNDPFILKDINKKRALITGGTSGIGKEVALILSGFGCQVDVTGRSLVKGNALMEQNPPLSFFPLDMANWPLLQNFCKNSAGYDYIVLNAGSMPEDLILNDLGVENQCASQLVGHYLLINLLLKHKKINQKARIIWVSSGGMYLKKLDLNSLFYNTKYEKVSTYANVKRAQVTLVEELAKQSLWQDFMIVSMHPGWVDTRGLKDALPQFYNLFKNRLRTPKQAADTILWTLLTSLPLDSGGFYFDRQKVSPYFFSNFNPDLLQRSLLLKKINSFLF